MKHTCGYGRNINKVREVVTPNSSFNRDPSFTDRLYDTVLSTCYMHSVPMKLMKKRDCFVLETKTDYIRIKIIDVQIHDLNYEVMYPVEYLLGLEPVHVKEHVKDYANDIIFNIVNYLEFLKAYHIFLGYENIIVLANVPNLDNAFWNGSYLTFGNGTIHHHPLTSSAIVGHELTHALVQQINDLEYRGHSGALNESFADIFGVMFEFYVHDKYNHTLGWEIGSECNFILRNIAEPELCNQPRYMYDSFYFNPEGYEDNGGVHVNSGIINHIFYEMQLYIDRKITFDIFINVLYRLKKNSNFHYFKVVLLNVIREMIPREEDMLTHIINRHIC